MDLRNDDLLLLEKSSWYRSGRGLQNAELVNRNTLFPRMKENRPWIFYYCYFKN